jgi:hypothetical protein
MCPVSKLLEPVTEPSETSQIQSTKKPKRIFSKLVFIFGLLGEFYLALFHLALYLNRYDKHHQTAEFIFSLLGQGEIMGRGLDVLNPSLNNDGLFFCVMSNFYVFFLCIPTLRLLCFLCFIYVLFMFYLLSFDNDNKANPLLIAVLIVWLIYYIAFFYFFVSRPVETACTWPLTHWWLKYYSP